VNGRATWAQTLRCVSVGTHRTAESNQKSVAIPDPLQTRTGARMNAGDGPEIIDPYFMRILRHLLAERVSFLSPYLIRFLWVLFYFPPIPPTINKSASPIL